METTRVFFDTFPGKSKKQTVLESAGSNTYYPIWGRNLLSVQKPFGSSMIGHRSERFCVFLPIFAGRDGEGNEQKLGEEWGQAKQWKFVLKNPSVNGRSHLGSSQSAVVYYFSA